MQPRIRSLLDRIYSLYPRERLAASKERMRRLWAGEAPLDRLPWVAAPFFDYYVAGLSPEQVLVTQLESFVLRGPVDDDFIPAFFTGCHTGTMPGMFGAVEEIRGDDYSCAPLIHDADGARNLPAPRIATGSLAQGWLDMQAYLVRETAGRMPVHVTDMQGPLDICGKLWGYDQLYAAVDGDADAVAKMLRRASEAFILFWRTQADLLGERFVGTHLFGWDWVPPGYGASASMDSLVMVSPSFYRRFVQGELEWLAGELGGLCIHSCGTFKHMGKPLLATAGLTGINAGQMGMADLSDAGFDGSIVLIAQGDLRGLERDLAAISSRGLRSDLTLHGLWPEGLEGSPARWSEEHWREIVARSAEVNRAMTTAAADWRRGGSGVRAVA